jgi:hypothetical protein
MAKTRVTKSDTGENTEKNGTNGCIAGVNIK